MVKKKTHIDFCHELKAQNLKVTVLGTYKDYNSKIAVKCDKCGCEWSPRAGSLLHGHGCPRCAGVKLKSHAEFVKVIVLPFDFAILRKLSYSDRRISGNIWGENYQLIVFRWCFDSFRVVGKCSCK